MNSVINKIPLISDFLEENNIDIFGICESWLLPDIPDFFVNISNFSITRTDSNSQTRKHGVCIYVKSHISHISINTSCDNVCAIHLLTYNLYLIVVYRPPSNSCADNQVLLNFLRIFCPGKEVLILGDFNLPLINWQTKTVLSVMYPPTASVFCGLLCITWLAPVGRCPHLCKLWKHSRPGFYLRKRQGG